MLKKLMKYDLRAIGKYWFFIAALTLAICIFEGFLLRLSISLLGNGRVLWAVFGMIGFYFGMVSVSMTLPLTLILVFYRFYKQLYTDEGYLIFTLPVTRRQVLTSKTLSAIIWTILQLGVIGVGACSILLIAPPASENGAYFNSVIFSGLLSVLRLAWSDVGAWVIVYAVCALAFGLLCIWIAVGVAQLCITVGATVFKKFKLVAAIVIYGVANAFVLVVVDMLTSVSVILLADGFVDILAASGGVLQCVAFTLILLISCIMAAVVAVLVHLTTLDRIERKLSLS